MRAIQRATLGESPGIWRYALAAAFLATPLSGGCVDMGKALRVMEVKGQMTVERSHSISDPGIVSFSTPSDDGSILIQTDGVVYDMGHSWTKTTRTDLDADQYVGRAIVIRNAKNVTVKNATISGFKIAIYAENAPGLTIENCNVSNNYRQRLKSTPEKEDESDWLYGHENDNDEWLRYGGGIFLKNCPNATIKKCVARNGQNGICLVRCDGVTVVDCDMSFMSGWGLAMWRSSKCKIIGNRFDYCVRGYSHGVYARGQDSTGILVYEQCSDNIFAYNHATHGGDGFFLYAGNQTVNNTGEGGCNRNLIYMNNFSHAIANGIEATFSSKNKFYGNLLTECDYGIWAGYSRKSEIGYNIIDHCRQGIAIEHGQNNKIITNLISNCGINVNLWWDDDTELLQSKFCQVNKCKSCNEEIRSNVLRRAATGVRISSSENITITDNHFANCKVVLEALGHTTLADDGLTKNRVLDGEIRNQTQLPLNCNANSIAKKVTVVGPVEFDTPRMNSRELFEARMEPQDNVITGFQVLEMSFKSLIVPELKKLANDFPLAHRPPGLLNIPEGKQHILIDEWGPYDFSSPKLTPLRATCWGTSKLRVLGSGQPFKVESLSAGISASPMSGVAPAEITLRGADPNSSMIPYDVKLSLDGKLVRASGTLWQADWAVVYHTWDGSTDPRKGEEFWRRGRNFKPPILKENRDRIDFHWGGGGPTPDVKDHFALVTTTTLTLPAGQWRLRTISDDGVRVYLDKKKVIDNWTWHIPTEDKADVNVSEGPHEIRIEYFEIDGNAQLQFMIEPAPSASSQPAS